jgi:hypothetical protein
MKILTEKQQAHLTKICKYCKGTGQDLFNKSQPCPNCNTNEVIIKNMPFTKQEFKDLTGEDPNDVFGSDWENELEDLELDPDDIKKHKEEEDELIGDEDEINEPSEDYPIGGMVEPYDIEKEKKL